MGTSTSKGLYKPDPVGEDVDIADINGNTNRINDYGMGAVVCTSTTRPSGANVWEGLTIVETDTGFSYVRIGGNWRFITSNATDANGFLRTLNSYETAAKIASGGGVKWLAFGALPFQTIVELQVTGAGGFAGNVGDIKLGLLVDPAPSTWRGHYGSNNFNVRSPVGEWTTVSPLISAIVIPPNTLSTFTIVGYTTAADGAYWRILYKAQRFAYPAPTGAYSFDGQ